MRRLVLLAVVGFSLFALAQPASAVPVDSVGDSFTVDFNGNVGGVDVPGLTASALVNVTALTSNSITLSVTLQNTSDSAIWQSTRVSAFGFDTDATISSAVLSSSVFGNANLGGHFPNNFGGVDVCVINNANNCTGGANGGLTIGQATTFSLRLNFAQNISTLELDGFGVRYQSLTSEQLGMNGRSGTGSPGNPIPEPGSTAMFLLGGAIVAALVRKQVLTARS